MMATIRTLTIFMLVWAPGFAAAAVVHMNSEAELVQKSDAIVMGTIASLSAQALPRGGVITTAEVQVFRSLRGVSPGTTVSVLVPGGQLKNGLTSYVTGAPIPRVGDWVVLLLEAKGEHWTPRGLSLGWIQLKGSQSKGFIAYRDLAGISLIGSQGEHISSEPYLIRAQALESLWADLSSRISGLSSPRAGEVKP